MKKTASILFFIALFVSGVIAFADEPAAKKGNRPDVPFVEKSETIGVSRVLIKIPYGTKVAHLSGPGVNKDIEWQRTTIKNYEQFREVAEADLKNYGYNVLTEDLFQTSGSAKARFQIGGIVTNFSADYRYQPGGCFGAGERSESKISLDTEFQLYDSVKDAVVLKKTETGKYENRNDIEELEKLTVMGYEDALLRFMAEQEFVDLLTGKKTKAASDESAADAKPITVAYSESAPKLTIPKDISKLFSGVVTIKAGMTHGSGVIVSEDGYILTAAHVVSGLTTVGVSLEDGKQYEAKVVRFNRNNDSAVIKIKGKKFKYIPLSTTQPPIGSEVYVIGTPLYKELSYTVTKGIVSGYREKDGVKYIQTDSAVNPGNSGGPMLDGNGSVIGIISSKAVGNAVESIGFAIPTAEVLGSLKIEK
ncbi:MAG: serine protease [Spirochaetales bacterium]|nr:serine protease [Spirochaetales bacterium]